MSEAITPFTLAIPQGEIDALHQRIGLTRWPEKETVDGWTQGAPLAAVRALADHWRTAYDWRRCEARLNALGQFRTEIDGLGIHFLHVRSPNPDALPLVMTHGWPGSVIEFLKVIEPLADPARFGGDPADAFHIVCPSLPGYGFSDKPAEKGWTIERIGAAWETLMHRLGYGDRFVAQGGDWGSSVTLAMARAKAKGLAGIHLNMVLALPPDPKGPFDAEELDALAAMKEMKNVGSGYSKLQSTKPQTIGYALADSPVAQAAWIYEKFQSWTDCDGTPENVLRPDEMLDNIMLYWLPGNGASSARLYWESFRSSMRPQPLDLPVAATIFPKEMSRPPRTWAEPMFPNLVYWNRAEKGGHFAAFEQPEIFVREVRNGFRPLR